jgi:hypothetical protein
VTIADLAQVLTGGAALVAAIASLRNGRKIQIIHDLTNSRLSELISVTKSEAHAAGVKEQQDRE